jgi:hypothetical protein
MGKESKNPFAIKQSPVRIITAQAVNIDDFVQEMVCNGDVPRCDNSIARNSH